MRIEQSHWTAQDGWHAAGQCDALRTHTLTRDRSADHDGLSAPAMADADLVLVFGGTDRLDAQRLAELRTRYPAAVLFGCSTSGEILGVHVHEDTVVASAIHFDHTRLHLASQAVPDAEHSHSAGQELGAQLPTEG